MIRDECETKPTAVTKTHSIQPKSNDAAPTVSKAQSDMEKNEDDINLVPSRECFVADIRAEVVDASNANTVVLATSHENRNDINLVSSSVVEGTTDPAKTFAKSNYKWIYAQAKRARFQYNLLGAVEKVVTLYATRINPDQSEHFLKDQVDQFMKQIQDEAFKDDQTLQNDVDGAAEYLWTSAKRHDIVNRMELCSVLNAVIRDDLKEEIEAAAVVIRSIVSRCVQRDDTDCVGLDRLDPTYPTDGVTWRGGGFRNQFQTFFKRTKGQKYRVPGFLATSNNRRVAATFAFKADSAHPRVLWRVNFDRRGKYQPAYRIRHMTFVSKTLVKGEGEYLFAPYSVFKLVSLKWSENLTKPHELTVEAVVDNRCEDESLPLAPWY